MVKRVAGLMFVGLSVSMFASGGCSSSTTTPPPATNSGKLSQDIGPIDLAPGQETTMCITVRLPNKEAIMATRFSATLAPGSHHLIVYRSSRTEESATPVKCEPFGGILGGSEVPIMLVERPDDDVKMPPNVGLKLEANQMVKLEAHYINTSKDPIKGKGTFNVESVPAAQAASMIESDLSFWGSTKITIDPKQTFDTGTLFQPMIAGTKGFATTTHQHRLGTKMSIWYSKAAGDTSAPPVAVNTDWEHPTLFKLDPELQFNGNEGLSYKCEYNNTTDSKIIFGESALQEMCFLWMYYYPSHGFDICFDGHCFGKSRKT